eukprot:1332180-Rhodomonas_salina.2
MPDRTAAPRSGKAVSETLVLVHLSVTRSQKRGLRLGRGPEVCGSFRIELFAIPASAQGSVSGQGCYGIHRVRTSRQASV